MNNLPDLWTPFSDQTLDDLQAAIPAAVDHWIQEWELASALVVGLFDESLSKELAMRSVNTVCIEPNKLLGKCETKTVDLIVCLEALRALSPEMGDDVIVRLCQWSDNIIFSYHPFEGSTPGRWAGLFAAQGFYRDLADDASNLLPWAVRYCRADLSNNQVSAIYENHLWSLQREADARRLLGIQQQRTMMDTNVEQQSHINCLTAQVHTLEVKVHTLEVKVHTLEKEIQVLKENLKDAIANADAWRERWEKLEAGIAWPLLQKLQNLRANLAPPGSTRERWLEVLFAKQPLIPPSSRNYGKVIVIAPVMKRPPVPDHTAAVDIIVCVYNALEDVRRCLTSVVEHTTQPYHLILVDDGSDVPTRDFLVGFAEEYDATLLRSEQSTGYTFAANRGLRASNAGFVLLLNSDTIVSPSWLDRLVACAESDPRIGIVGPLSNTASWQSIPELADDDDWAQNPLPENMTVVEMGDWVARTSGRLYPRRKLLNGFCLLLRREMLAQVGYFDEETFGAGYGEEDDLALRARTAGWELALADDVYVYHAQSRSYSNEQRKRLSTQAGDKLRAKHGNVVEISVAACADDRIMAGIRARSRVIYDRRDTIRQGHERFAGRGVLFVLPVNTPGGGANIVISEAQAMRTMGVNVELFNLPEYQNGFEYAYPNLGIPTLYGTREDLPFVAASYDAVIATYNPSVAWLEAITEQIVRAYYVQGFEPLMYMPGTKPYQDAIASYTLFSNLVRFTKTEWTRRTVLTETGVDSAVVGPSFELDLFRPRPRQAEPGLLRIAAMIRPDSPYRSPAMTMRLLKQAMERYPGKVEAWIFGTNPDNPLFQTLPRDFGWRLAGILTPWQVANFLNETDIFVDFSTHQAMGLTAMEAMGCGNAVIVPENGGATSFADHEQNSLVVDTISETACWEALERLIIEDGLRHGLQTRALEDICTHFPERAAFNILQVLFGAGTR